MVGNQQFLLFIDVYSKFATLVEVTSKDCLEAKREEIKSDKDSALMCEALHKWLNSEGVKI